MKKEFTIRIYKQKAGENCKQLITSYYDLEKYHKDEAFTEARKELVQIAIRHFANRISKASQKHILEQIKAVENGANNYYFDGTNYFFEVFSKKCK